MRHFLLLGACALLAPVTAQIVIGPADMPIAGDTMRYQTTLPAGINVEQTGPGVVWDFGDLQPLLPGADTAVTVASTPFLYQFFFNNNILYPEHAANYAVKGMGFSLQGITLENVFEYYKIGPTGFRNVGFGATINGLPASVRRIPVDWIHRFPMEYGDTDDSFSEFQIDIPTLGFFGQTQQRDNVVDGWGTLYLPADTFQVLRVRSTLTRRDTIFVDQIGIGFGFDEPLTVEYKWIAPGMDVPVLLVTTTAGVPGTARFHYNPGVTSVEETISGTLPQVFPNPASEMVRVRIPEGWRGQLFLHDATGRVVLGGLAVTPGADIALDLGGLAAGSYLLRIQGTSLWTTRLVVAR
ncbi:MAG: T9SS type A sorting domain-containing protein [Flavobacteriales bacterium]|nr:T9SS type A sorting domain-containing protein [Flavobacteriales bacterium]